MNYQHKELASGRWKELSLIEQMANVGSEVERALNWKNKNNQDYSTQAFHRALELLDLTIQFVTQKSHLKELCRVREFLVDFFIGSNQFSISESDWRQYFLQFAFAARLNK